MAERSQPALGVNKGRVKSDGLLPEGAPHHGALPGYDRADADEPKLCVGAADHDRRALGQTRLVGRLPSDAADHRAGLEHLRTDGGLQTADLKEAPGPHSGGKVKEPRA